MSFGCFSLPKQSENMMLADTSSVFGRRSPMTAGQQHLLCNLIEFPFYLNTVMIANRSLPTRDAEQNESIKFHFYSDTRMHYNADDCFVKNVNFLNICLADFKTRHETHEYKYDIWYEKAMF